MFAIVGAFSFFFFNAAATTEIYTLSLHDALPICGGHRSSMSLAAFATSVRARKAASDRKSTRLNSSHVRISYADFSLKKKKQPQHNILFSKKKKKKKKKKNTKT